MSCNDNLKLKGLEHWGGTGITNQIEVNLKARIDWGLLCAGAWQDVTQGLIGLGGNDWSCLVNVIDNSYDNGQCWQGIRKDWIWESVIYTDSEAVDHSPLTVTVWVNGILEPNFTVNYPEGKIILDVAIPTTSLVQAQFSFRVIQTYIGDSTPWWQQIQRGSFNIGSDEFKQDECGAWSIGSHHRIQLPTIIIDAVPQGEVFGYIGTCCRESKHDVLFHIISESKSKRNDILDMLLFQSDREICSFDCDEAAVNDSLLNCDGSIGIGTLDYSQLVTTYPWTPLRLGKGFITYLNTVDCRLYEGMIHIPVTVSRCTL